MGQYVYINTYIYKYTDIYVHKNLAINSCVTLQE